MKNILTLILACVVTGLFSQTTVQGTILVEQQNVASVYILPSADIVGINATNNILSFNVAISIDATNLASAPVVSFTNNLIGVSFTSVDLIEGRHVYTFAGNSAANAFTWPGGLALKLIDIVFPNDPIVGQKFPRLADYANIDGGPSFQSYFYLDVNGTDFTNYTQYFYNGNQGTTPSSTYVESLNQLPITLHTFSAEKYSDRSAKLTWVTSSEINSSHFGIERSADGLTDWTKLGEVKAAGNSNYHVNYNFIDNTITTSRNRDQVYYYRLQMTDMDGAFKYSDVRGVNFGLNLAEEIKLYPNPTVDKINIDLSALDFSEKVATMNVYDFNGKLVSTKEVNGAGIELLDMQNLQSGMYNVIIQHKTDTFTYKVIKVD